MFVWVYALINVKEYDFTQKLKLTKYKFLYIPARLDWEKLLEYIKLSSEKLDVKQKAMDDFHSSPF